MSNDKSRKPKKSETLEVRIPYETKQAFLTACREDGTTASEVVRGSVQTYLDSREQPHPQRTSTLIMKFPRPVRRYAPRVAAGALAAIGLATFAVLPSAAAPDFATMFKQLDANGDGVLTAEEFSAPPRAETQRAELRAAKHLPQGVTAAIAGQTPMLFRLPAEPDRQLPPRTEILHQNLETTPPPTAAERRTDQFAALDADSDGKAILAEFTAYHRKLLTNGFAGLDKDGNDFLTRQEYSGIAVTLIVTPEGHDTRIMTKGSVGAVVSREAINAEFSRLDRNADDRLSVDEYLSPD
jgi:hypothetical protein